MTFFDFPGIPKGVHGTNEISKLHSVFQLMWH